MPNIAQVQGWTHISSSICNWLALLQVPFECSIWAVSHTSSSDWEHSANWRALCKKKLLPFICIMAGAAFAIQFSLKYWPIAAICIRLWKCTCQKIKCTVCYYMGRNWNCNCMQKLYNKAYYLRPHFIFSLPFYYCFFFFFLIR